MSGPEKTTIGIISWFVSSETELEFVHTDRFQMLMTFGPHLEFSMSHCADSESPVCTVHAPPVRCAVILGPHVINQRKDLHLKLSQTQEVQQVPDVPSSGAHVHPVNQ